MADLHHTEVDKATGITTTGHSWDGIKELNTPLPKWWLYMFYMTIVWGIIYTMAYPAWPTLTGYTKGFLGYASRAEIITEMDALKAQRAAKGAALATASVSEVLANPALLTFAQAQGKAAFGDNCAPCHGTGATGSAGYPNLRDDDWLWGGKIDDVYQTIQYGIRSGHDKARQGNMIPFGGVAGVLKPDEIVNTAAFVRTLSGLEPNKAADVAKGKELFAANCAACHGDEGKGNLELGAPNLTDKIWLYGSDEASLIQTITNGRGGVMPAWEGRLDPTTVKALAVYVHTLGGGTK